MITELAMPDCSFACRIDAYYDGELEPEAQGAFEEHLGGCADCRRELASLRQLSGHFASTEVSSLTRTELRRLYDTPKAEPERSLFSFAVGLLATAASLLIVSAAWLSEIPPVKPAAPVVAMHDVPDWERFAMSGQTELPPGLGDRTAVADADLADWMLSGLSSGREP
jgi:anti-sigma factor RsiW